MAGRSSSLSMVGTHRLFAPSRPPAPHGAPAVELDEADVIWGGGGSAAAAVASSPVDPYSGRAPSLSKPSKPRGAAAAASLPVNIPDWSKILGAEYGNAGAVPWPSDERGDAYYLHGGSGGEEDGQSGGGGRRWVPPHEVLLCRERAAASFSVREGAGRTLKGRDLRRVRNAIWEKTGFQD